MSKDTPAKPELVIAATPLNAEEFVAIATMLWRTLKGVEPTAKNLAVFRTAAEQQFGPTIANCEETEH